MIGVLRYVRAEIIRDGLGGLEHANALLLARGVDPEALPVPRKQPKRFRRGALRMAILRALFTFDSLRCSRQAARCQ